MPDLVEDYVACRICMDSKHSYVSIFSQDLSAKVMVLADVQVEKNDGLPESICSECEHDLEKCYEFRIKVQTSDKKFRENMSQVDIEECNIKEESYMDEIASDNVDDKDSDRKEDDRYNDVPETLQKAPEETREAVPDPLNHVVVVGENERMCEMSKESLNKHDTMIEESQVLEMEEVAFDSLECMKEEAEAMDVDSNQRDPLGSSSVSDTALPISMIPPVCTSVDVKRENEILTGNSKPRIAPRITDCHQQLTGTKRQRRILPAIKHQERGINCVNNNEVNQPNQSLMLLPQTAFNLNTGILVKCVKFTPRNIVIPKNLANTLDSTPPLISFQNSATTFENFTLPSAPVDASSLKNYMCSVATGTQKESEQGADLPDLACKDLDENHQKPEDEDPNEDKVSFQNVTTAIENVPLSSASIDDSSLKTSKNSDTADRKESQQATQPSDVSSKIRINSAIQNHLKQKDEEPKGSKTFFCLVCNIDCGCADLFDEHKTGQSLICRVCAKIFNNHQELEKHFFSHTQVSCQVCKKVFYSRSDHLHHKRTVSTCNKVLREICKLCGYTFTPKHMERHMRRKHPNGEQSVIICSICERTFKNESQLSCHSRLEHSAYESLACDICDKIVIGPRKMRLHVKSVHVDGYEPCSVCKKVFVNKTVLARHMERHTAKEIVCEVCGALCKGKIALKTHMRHRHSKKLKPCKICNVSFKSNSERYKHNKTFHREKSKASSDSYVCEVCGKKFKSSTIMKHHMVTHSDEKPYVCGICGAAFKLKVVLTTHSRIHSEPRKYICSHCGKGFRWKKTFDKHMSNCDLSVDDDISSDSD